MQSLYNNQPNLLQKGQNFFSLLSHWSALLFAFVIPINLAATNYLFFATVLFMLLSGNLKNKISSIVDNPLTYWMLAFFALFLIGVFYGHATYNEAFRIVLKHLKFFFAPLLLLVFLEEKWRQRIIWAFICACLLTLFLYYLRNFGLLNFQARYGGPIVFRDHIHTSFVMAFASYFLGLHAYYFKKYRWLILSFFVLVIHYLFFINTGRSGQVIAIFLILLLGYQLKNWQGFLIATCALILIIASSNYFSNVLSTRYDDLPAVILYDQLSETTGDHIRLDLLHTSFQLFQEAPFIGKGTAGVDFNPHSQYAYIAIQFGLIGLFVLLAMFFFLWKASHRLPRQERYIAQAVIISFFLGGLINSWPSDSGQGFFFVCFLALSFATFNSDKKLGN